MANQTWKQKAIALAMTGVMSWREIANVLDVPKSSCSDFLRKNLKTTPEYEEKKSSEDNSRILFISDMHVPYHHKDTLEFLAHLKKKYEPTRVISLGDEADGHSIGYHESSPELYSAGHELEATQVVMKQLETLFPKMDLVDSNHGSLAYRRAKTHGIPKHYIKSYNDVLGVGEGWKWHPDLLLTLPDGQNVYVHHGKNTEAIKVSQMYGCSHVCGHYHESFGIKYWSTPTALHFAVNSGCLIDKKSLAFAYNINNMKRPIIGTSLIIDGKPILETLEM